MKHRNLEGTVRLNKGYPTSSSLVFSQRNICLFVFSKFLIECSFSHELTNLRRFALLLFERIYTYCPSECVLFSTGKGD
jgi:hypothetical protein